MQLISIEAKSAKKLFWGIVLGYSLVCFWTVNQENPILLAASFLLAVVGLWPLYLWLIGSSYGLPIWPAFAAYVSALSALPVLQGSKTLALYSQDAVLVALGTVGGFLFLGTVIWIPMTSGSVKPRPKVVMLESGTAVNSLLWCLAAGLLFSANSMAGWFSFPGNTMQVARGISGGLAYLGAFALAYFHGAGSLKMPQVVLYLTMLGLLMLCSVSGIMLAPALPFLALALIGFSLGSGRLPVAGIVCAFVAFSILHTGKYQMRSNYYESDGEQKALPSGMLGLPSFYAEWTTYGLESLGGLGGVMNTTKREDAPSSVFDRAGNLHNLLLVQDKSPSVVPFLNGITYEPILMMLIPRFLAPDKSISHAGNIMLSINYGVVDVESARGVSIGWSLIAEAYANFGYLGVVLLAVFLSVLYSYITRLTSGVPITSFPFVAGLVVLAGITNENSLGVFITMQFQGVVGVALASIFLMRRQSNPYATGEEHTVPQTEGRVERGGNRHPEGSGIGDGPKANGLHGNQTTNGSGRVFSADGGTVRTMPGKTPQRMARWMPRRMRAAVAAAARSAAEGVTEGVSVGQKDGVSVEPSGSKNLRVGGRPQQVAVPFQNYRRYRG
jgi:hypothetical protein